MGEHRFLSRLRLWAEKLERVDPYDAADNEAAYWGNVLEKTLVKEFETRSHRKTRPFGWLVNSTAHPWALATPDAVQYNPVTQRWDIPTQIKTTSAYLAPEWREGPPREVWWQMQQEMLVLGAPWASVAALLGGQRFVWADVECDDYAQERIIEEGSYFWGQVVTEDMPLDHITEDDSEVIKALWPTAIEGSEIVLPDDAIDWDRELRVLEQEKKDVDKRIEALKNKLKAAIGANEIGVLSDGSGFYTYKNRHTEGYEVKPKDYRVLLPSKRT